MSDLAKILAAEAVARDATWSFSVNGDGLPATAAEYDAMVTWYVGADENGSAIEGPAQLTWTEYQTISVAQSLAVAKDEARAKIAVQAEVVRARYITAGSGKALEYERKRAEAEAIDGGATPSETDHPFIWAEAQVALSDGTALERATTYAVIIKAKSDAWTTVGKAIATAERAALVAIDAATTEPEVRAAVSGASWTSLLTDEQ
jgi:hypothetical protein